MSLIFDVYQYNNYKPKLEKGFKLNKKYHFNVKLFEDFYNKFLAPFFSREREFIILCELDYVKFEQIKKGEIEDFELRSIEIMASIMGVDFFDLIIVEDN